MSQSSAKPSSSSPPKAAISAKTTAPCVLYPLPENKRAQFPMQDTFEVDRVRYRQDEGSWYFWQLNKDKPIAHHLCLENGMYRPYVHFRIADRRYGLWVIIPETVNKLEFCSEKHLVKITRSLIGQPRAELWVGFTDPFNLAGFVGSFKQGWPTKEVVQMDMAEVPLLLLRE